jgi:hypothetical protein
MREKKLSTEPPEIALPALRFEITKRPESCE